LRKISWWLIPGHEPGRDKSDPAVFDTIGFTKPSRRYRLLDGELPNHIEERCDESKNPYLLKRRPKPFRNRLTGEIVLRLRSGKNFERVYPPWNPEGLLRIRGRLLATSRPSKDEAIPTLEKYVRRGGMCLAQLEQLESLGRETGLRNDELLAEFPHRYRGATIDGRRNFKGAELSARRRVGPGGREFVWGEYSHGWAARESDPGPHVVRKVAWLALNGADITGCNIPDAAEFAARTVEASRLAKNDVESIGPRLDETPERSDPLLASRFGPQTLYRLEMEDAERKKAAARSRARTSEYRNEQTGEYGPETKMTRDGRVWFGKSGQPWTNRVTIKLGDLGDYLQRRSVKFKGGRTKRVGAQRAAARLKPGPKSQNGFTMNARLRKIKQRCRERGVPFVIENYLEIAASGLSPPANSPGRHGVSPCSPPFNRMNDENARTGTNEVDQPLSGGLN
jgi:hypothetical protein